MAQNNTLKAWEAYIYPNPIAVGKNLTINLAHCPETTIKISLWNTNGSKVAESWVETKGLQQIILPIQEKMAPGIYLLRLIDENANMISLKVTIA